MDACCVEHPFQSGRHADGAPLRPGGDELTGRAIACAGFAPGERVLDLGCGVGAGTQLLLRRGCRAVGIDLASRRLALARQSAPQLAVVAADAHCLPFADESLDGILAECSLTLAGYTSSTLTECRRVLRPGGRLAVTDLFVRVEDVGRAPLPGCMDGMIARNAILAALADAGFAVRRWEDHSDVLKSFMAQLIFSGRGAEALWFGNGSAYSAALRACRPGYFLLIAERSDPDER